jgi:hypothetical protein
MCRCASRGWGPGWIALWLLLCLPGRAVHSQVTLDSSFIRGDVDGNGRVLAGDAIVLLGHLFRGDPVEPRCLDAADVDDDGGLDITDAVYLLNSLFLGGAPPLPPFPFCGEDFTDDGLTCEVSASCLSPSFEFAGRELLDGGGVFFVVDRSGSMQDSGELQIAKREIIRTLRENRFPQFGIVFFDANILSFPADLRPADGRDDATVAEAIAFVNSVPGGAGSCVQKGLLAALRFVALSSAAHNLIIYVGDGGGHCGGSGADSEADYLQQTLEVVTAANDGRARIYTIGLLMAGKTLHEDFLRRLAAANGGSYFRVN